MGATNTTANYNLSQFIGTDKPAWLQDYNGDMLKIDTGINAAKVAADGAQNSADAAQNDATTANNAISNTINPAISSLNTTVGNQGGAINTINSLIGNGTPTTTDQTIIGAINEINAQIQDSGEQDLTSAYTAKYRKIGKLVEININSETNTFASGSAIVIGTLPAGYRPSERVLVPAVFGAASDIMGVLGVRDNGEVYLKQNSGSNQAYGCAHVTFFTV